MINETKIHTKLVKKHKRFNKDNLQLGLLQLPGLLHLFIFSYVPLVFLVIAFKDYKFNLGVFGSEWCGFDNFKFLLESNTFFTLVKNTLGYNLVFILLSNILQLISAILLYNISNKLSIKFFQSSIFLPHFLSWIVIGYITYAFLNTDIGIINNILNAMGMKSISFYSEAKYWPIILTAVNMWKGIGFGMLVYYGTILSVDTSLLEAAAIDGCGYLRRIWHIIIPHVKQTTIILIILALGGIFKSDFGLFYYIPRDIGALYSTTDVLDTYITRSILVTGSLGSSTAAGLLQSVVGCILVITVNKIIKKFNEGNSLF